MAKVESGRLTRLSGMATFTAVELNASADRFDARACDRLGPDDPSWRRWAGKLRRLAARKERAAGHKAGLI